MLTTNLPILILTSKSLQQMQALQTYTEIEECLKKPLVLHYLYVIANTWSDTSSLLQKRLLKVKALIKNEMSHSTKKLNLANLRKRLTPKSSVVNSAISKSTSSLVASPSPQNFKVTSTSP